MTDQGRPASELVEAAAVLEAYLPADHALVLGEVRSAGYAVRQSVDMGPGVFRFAAPQGIGHGKPEYVGMLVIRDDEITYAEWAGTVYPMWAGWTDRQRTESIRTLLLAIRDDRR